MNKAIALTVLTLCCFVSLAAQAGPREECASTGATMPCLDAKLKDANQRLNLTLKAAQERLEQLQAQGRRPMMGAFVDSQRKFNAYRDAQCSWQGVRAAPGENTAEYVRECQLLATLAREDELAAFARDEVSAPPAATAPSVATVQAEPAPQRIPSPTQTDPPAGGAVDPVAPPGATPPPAPSQSATGSRGVEWRLVTWIVGGQEKEILQNATISVSFDPSGKIAGNASVNRFSGTYRFDEEGRLQWPRSGFVATRMGGPPALMAQERAFLESLRRTTRYKVEGQQLVLESQNSSVVLAFTR